MRNSRCSEEDCGSPTIGQGLCGKHYQRKKAADVVASGARCLEQPCEIPPLGGRGLCRQHYKALRRQEVIAAGGLEAAWESQFWAYVEVRQPLACWIWTGSVSKKGYGRATVAYRANGAHRLAYEYFHGPLGLDPATGDPLEIDHLCKNRGCVNPDHMEPVTHAENIWRSARYAGHEACRQGHARAVHGGFNINGHQFCKACARIWQDEFRARKAS